jgi:hypothetical protein
MNPLFLNKIKYCSERKGLTPEKGHAGCFASFYALKLNLGKGNIFIIGWGIIPRKILSGERNAPNF